MAGALLLGKKLLENGGGAMGLGPAAFNMLTKKKKSAAEDVMDRTPAKKAMKKGGKTGYKAGASVKARGEGCCARSKKCKMY